MTHAQRNEKILKILEEQTVRITATKASAREALIKEGIYTKRGKLRAEFGGGKRAAVAA